MAHLTEVHRRFHHGFRTGVALRKGTVSESA